MVAVGTGFTGMKLFSADGELDIPAGIVGLHVYAWGGGGGGGGTAGDSYPYNLGGGGGAGAIVRGVALLPDGHEGLTLAVKVGAAGTGGDGGRQGAPAGDGTDGGSTTIKNGTTVLFSADGGKGGKGGTTTAPGAPGDSGSGTVPGGGGYVVVGSRKDHEAWTGAVQSLQPDFPAPEMAGNGGDAGSGQYEPGTAGHGGVLLVTW
jgi:hypothetical protein